MTTVLICKDALEDSVLGNIALGRTLAKRQGDVTVVFVGEALWALAGGTFEWAQNFKGREMRSTVIRGADRLGHGIADAERDPRWTDIRAFVRSASAEPGLRLVACPIWTAFLGLDADPDYLQRIDEQALADLITSANTVIGSY
ncbi:MAG: hypothetical protein HY875_03925 [Chloroflexi bacterium]|nr:hypothetical protein [Chloroflexota bacterium]